MTEKEQLMTEKEQLMTEKEQQMIEKDQLQQELQTANTRADEQLQQLRQQVSIVTLFCLMIFILSAISHDDDNNGEGNKLRSNHKETV